MRKVSPPGLLRTALFALILAACDGISPPAQVTFQRTYGGEDFEWGHSVAQTTDDGYIIAGETHSFGVDYSDIYLVKTDAAGDTMWTRTYGGASYDYGYSVAQTADGGYVIVGYTYSFGAGQSDVYLVKTDASGDTMWTRAYGGTSRDCGYSVAQTADGGYVITGWTDSFGAGWNDAWLIKTDASGDTMWTRTFDGALVGRSVAQTADGGYVITGHAENASSNDAWLLKTDASGGTIWTRTFGGADWDEGRSVRQTADGGFVITGGTYSFGAGQSDVYLVKTDASGDTMWTRTYGGGGWDEGYSVTQTTDNGYVIAGRTKSFGAGGNDVWLIKTDAWGDTVWTRTFGGADWDEGCSVTQTTDNGYVIAGYTYSFGAGASDVWLIKTDSAGRVAITEP